MCVRLSTIPGKVCHTPTGCTITRNCVHDLCKCIYSVVIIMASVWHVQPPSRIGFLSRKNILGCFTFVNLLRIPCVTVAYRSGIYVVRCSFFVGLVSLPLVVPNQERWLSFFSGRAFIINHVFPYGGVVYVTYTHARSLTFTCCCITRITLAVYRERYDPNTVSLQ